MNIPASSVAPPSFTVQALQDAEVFKISPNDSNYFVLLATPQANRVSFVQVIEIFEVGGATPPNSHTAADEIFYVLSGTGEAVCNGQSTTIRSGHSLIVHAGSEHVVRNTGRERLYCLTTMIPDESFAELIRNGLPWKLDASDMAKLGSIGVK
jgi:mannose-6-phosphate isomerase-like protein (cupin superfamily)